MNHGPLAWPKACAFGSSLGLRGQEVGDALENKDGAVETGMRGARNTETALHTEVHLGGSNSVHEETPAKEVLGELPSVA